VSGCGRLGPDQQVDNDWIQSFTGDNLADGAEKILICVGEDRFFLFSYFDPF
jgi:hypothetical protein